MTVFIQPTTAAPMDTWEQAVEWLRTRPEHEWREFVRQCYYDDPVLAAAARFCASEEWSGVKQLLENWLPGDVLEFGAGRGITSFAFASIGCRVTAVEPDPSSIVGRGAIESLSRFATQPIHTLADWGEHVDIPDESVDIVYCRAVLHHARDLPQLCREAFRVLRPGGVFLAEREHVLDRPEDLQVFLDKHPLHYRYGGEHAYLLRDYQNSICRAGFRLKRSIPPYHHVINFVPPMDLAHLRRMTEQALLKTHVLPRRLANRLAGVAWVRGLYARTLSWRAKTPGRFYSFLAVKRSRR